MAPHARTEANRRVRKRFLWLVVAVVVVVAVGTAAYHYYWVHRYDALIARAASVYQLDPALVRSVVHQESYFNPHASSRCPAAAPRSGCLVQASRPRSAAPATVSGRGSAIQIRSA